MKASFLDLRKRPGDLIRALDRNEKIELTYRGRPKAVMHPVGSDEPAPPRSMDHPAFGIWADRKDLDSPADYVRRLRKGRFHGV